MAAIGYHPDCLRPESEGSTSSFLFCAFCGARHAEGVSACPADGRPTHRVVRPSDVLGRRVAGDYVLLEPVSLGVESNVYRAVHLPTEREVALKVLRVDDPGTRARFEREGRILARLSNPHIVRVVGTRAEAVAGRFAARLAGLERSLGLAFRSRLASPESGGQIPDLEPLIGEGEPAFRELLKSLGAGAGAGDLAAAMEWSRSAHGRIATFWMERATLVGDPKEQAFCREAVAATRRHLAALDHLSERLGLGPGVRSAAGRLPGSGEALFDDVPTLAGAPGTSIRVTPELLTGIPMIDGQHRVLFETASRVLDRGFLAPSDQVIRRVLPYLQSYVSFHFAAEEFTMTFFGYPGITEHKAAHDHFRDRLGQVLETARTEGTRRHVRDALELRLVRLLYHVRTVDRALAAFLAETGGAIPTGDMDRAGIREPEPV